LLMLCQVLRLVQTGQPHVRGALFHPDAGLWADAARKQT
jgi:hypothetical protein